MDSEIHFTGFGNQGDGASFTCELHPEVFDVPEGCYIRRHLNQYCHEKSCHIDDHRISYAIRKEIMEAYYDLCKEIFKDLENEYEYLTSKEVVKEHYNGCLFYVDGRIYYHE